MKPLVSIAFAALVLAAGISAAGAGEIQFTVSGLRSVEGLLVVGVYDSQKTFGKQGRDIADAKIPVTSTTVHGIIRGIPDGTYALAVYHDENGNGKMDFNGLFPAEDYAFSNNVYGILHSKPSFRAAAIEVRNGVARVRVRLN